MVDETLTKHIAKGAPGSKKKPPRVDFFKGPWRGVTGIRIPDRLFFGLKMLEHGSSLDTDLIYLLWILLPVLHLSYQHPRLSDPTARSHSHSMAGVPRSTTTTIIVSYYLICPPFLPDRRTVRLILINEVKKSCIIKFPKLSFETSTCDSIFVCRAVIALNNYATFVEVEIMFWFFEIVRYRAEYCVTLETTFNNNECLLTRSGTWKIVKKSDSEQFWRVRH